MKAFMCGTGGNGVPEPDSGWPTPPAEPCCGGMAFADPGDEWAECECFVPIYANGDEGQAPPDPEHIRMLAAGIQPVTRTAMCIDCAYRPDSPEKSGDPRYSGDADFLEELAATGKRFWCHQGLLHPIAFRHPSGLEIPASPGMYPAPIVDGVPYKTDGTSADLCAGWDARRRALAAQRPSEAPT